MSVRPGQIVSWVFAACCAGFAVASYVNVFADNKDVEELARATAKCPKESCTLMRLDRGPLGQKFGFEGKMSVDVSCARSAVLVGAYSCAVVK
jgi:hypothetical protein